MTPFRTINSVVLPLLEDRMDTDVLFPARYLLLMQREGLGEHFCQDRRVAADGSRIAGNPLDDPRYAGAQTVLAGEDFGCGSSREQAVWSLVDFGIRCVIAVSFGEIFAANCLRNGVLAIALPDPVIDLLAATPGPLTVDLERQAILSGGQSLAFDVPPAHRQRLLNGWDDIDLILEQEGAQVAAFEAQQRPVQPWLYGTEA